MIKKPKNYKSIKKFAEKNNMCPENFLGEVYFGDLLLRSNIPANVILNVEGNLELDCKSIGDYAIINVIGDLTYPKLKKIGCDCYVFAYNTIFRS